MRDNNLYITYRKFICILCSLVYILLACSSKEEKKVEEPVQPVAVISSSKSDKVSELDIAKLQAQIEDLKQTVQKQKETIKVLEKSLVLGISPELYIDNQEAIYNSQNPMDLINESEPEQDPDSSQDSYNFKLQEASSSLTPSLEQNSKDFETRMRYASELYSSGSYGQAIVEYSDILKHYPKDNSEVKYWIGMCWYKLKEYNLSSKILLKFVAEDSSSPLVPQARLTLANSWLEQGYSDKAVKEYKSIIKTYPKDPVAKIAKQQILNSGKNL